LAALTDHPSRKTPGEVLMTLGIGFGLWHFFRAIERGSVIGSNPLPPHASPPVLTDS
jgi:hypothetical protein